MSPGRVLISQDRNCGQPVFNLLLDMYIMDVLKFFTVRLCPWDMHLTGRRRRRRQCRRCARVSISTIMACTQSVSSCLRCLDSILNSCQFLNLKSE